MLFRSLQYFFVVQQATSAIPTHIQYASSLIFLLYLIMWMRTVFKNSDGCSVNDNNVPFLQESPGHTPMSP